jgi:maltooligosyltrehalose trehalohydrolase
MHLAFRPSSGSDDANNVLHVLLTGKTNSYYADYAEKPAKKLARALAEGFVFQSEASITRKGEPLGTPSADLVPHDFVVFLQNHDPAGNRKPPPGAALLATVRGR